MADETTCAHERFALYGEEGSREVRVRCDGCGVLIAHILSDLRQRLAAATRRAEAERVLADAGFREMIRRRDALADALREIADAVAAILKGYEEQPLLHQIDSLAQAALTTVPAAADDRAKEVMPNPRPDDTRSDRRSLQEDGSTSPGVSVSALGELLDAQREMGRALGALYLQVPESIAIDLGKRFDRLVTANDSARARLTREAGDFLRARDARHAIDRAQEEPR